MKAPKIYLETNMTKYNFESWINKIRLELYEETKDLTIEQRVKRSNELAERLAEKYGFTVSHSVKDAEKTLNTLTKR